MPLINIHKLGICFNLTIENQFLLIYFKITILYATSTHTKLHFTNLIDRKLSLKRFSGCSTEDKSTCRELNQYYFRFGSQLFNMNSNVLRHSPIISIYPFHAIYHEFNVMIVLIPSKTDKYHPNRYTDNKYTLALDNFPDG